MAMVWEKGQGTGICRGGIMNEYMGWIWEVTMSMSEKRALVWKVKFVSRFDCGLMS